MKKNESGLHGRAMKVRDMFYSAGVLVAHFVVGAVLFMAVLTIEGLLSLLVDWGSHLVHNRWFTMLADALDFIFSVADILLVVFWVIHYARRSAKEISDE